MLRWEEGLGNGVMRRWSRDAYLEITAGLAGPVAHVGAVAFWASKTHAIVVVGNREGEAKLYVATESVGGSANEHIEGAGIKLGESFRRTRFDNLVMFGIRVSKDRSSDGMALPA